MDWDDVIAAIVADLFSDVDLVAALGGRRIGPWEAGAEEWTIPEVRYQFIADTNTEVENTILIQFDFKAASRLFATIIEKRLRKRMDYPFAWKTIGDVEMLLLLDDARDIADPEPGRLHRQLDFRATIARKRPTD